MHCINENDQKLRKLFEALDSNHNGYIDKKELLQEYNKYFPGTTKKQLKIVNNFLETADVDNNGKIDYAEFLTAMNLGNKEISKTTLREVSIIMIMIKMVLLKLKILKKFLKILV